MWVLYRVFSALLLATAGPLLLALRGAHYRATLAGRLGRRPPVTGPGGLWLHAVSVGEAAVAVTLARALPETTPLVVTTITPSGQERAARALAGRAAVGYFPFELDSAVRRFFDAVRPAALVLVEGDYWPLVLREARRRRVPVAVVNGRFSDRSFGRLRFLRRAVRPWLLDPVDRFGVQTALDRDRLLALGVPSGKVVVTGNLKFEAPAPPELPELAAWVRGLAAGRPVFVAGSTMPGEEERVLEAFDAARALADALLVVAPRHPERFDAVFAMLAARFPDAVRRGVVASPGSRPAVALLDSLGELASLYAHAHAAFVGGTLVPRGGHNPLEPARFAVPVACGPSMENFREIAEGFDRAGAWARVRDGRELGELWRRWLVDRGAASEIGRRGADLVAAHRGALERTRELLAPLLSELAERAPA